MKAVRHLRRHVHREVVPVAIVAGHRSDGIPLHGDDRHSLVLNAQSDHAACPRQRIRVGRVAEATREVRPELLELQRSPRLKRSLGIGHGGQRVEINHDELRGVHSGGHGLGDNDGDRLANKPDLVDGERRTDARLVENHETVVRLEQEILCGEDAEHPWGRDRLRGVDGVEARVRHG
jgi:hypothetical protein